MPTDSTNIAGKVVVTSASSGLGEATARHLAERGATVVRGARIGQLYDALPIPAESFARVVAFAMSQPGDVNINEILFRPTRQEL